MKGKESQKDENGNRKEKEKKKERKGKVPEGEEDGMGIDKEGM